jgi:hypothetical protein
VIDVCTPIFSHIFFSSFFINKDESCNVPVSVSISSHYVGYRFLLNFKGLVSANRMSCLTFSLMFITSHHYCLTTVWLPNYKICHFPQHSFLICQCNISGYCHIVVRPLLFWDVMCHRLAVGYRHFGTSHCSDLKRSNNPIPKHR